MVFVLTGEKPFSCIHCPAAFRNPSSLKQHLPVHTGVKPHRCRHCGKGFALSSKLARHVKKHDSDLPYITKPFSCRFCPSAFAQSATLATHLRKKHAFAEEMRTMLDPGRLAPAPPAGQENVGHHPAGVEGSVAAYYQEPLTGVDMSAFLVPASGQML